MINGTQNQGRTTLRRSRGWMTDPAAYHPHGPAVQVARTLMGVELRTPAYRAARLLEAAMPHWVPVSRDGGRVTGQSSINLMTARRAKEAATDLVTRWCDTLSRCLTAAGILHTVGWVETREQNHVEETREGKSAGRVFIVTARIVLSP